MMQPVAHEHDGTRRWALSYRGMSGRRASWFISDAVTQDGAKAHFAKCNPGKTWIAIQKIDPDRLLDR